jgi:serine/threonine protein kinase
MIGREIGPYRILQKLAQGGMCAVYKGVHTSLEQEVAVKILSTEAFDDKSVRERFINEAKIQAKLSHPNVVKTLNYVEQNNTVALVMEYINGETLDVLLKKAGAIPVERAIAILDSVFDAVDFMHSKGIVHRDIKPANIMLSYDGFVKVMDFGIAKVIGDSAKTKTGIRIGTLWYMSPEQIRGTGITVRSDIYSLGVMFYQMVTGKVPFNGETEFDIMKSHIEDAAVPPRKINSNISKEVGRIILKAMAKNPKDRYQGIREFGAELKAATHPESETRIMVDPTVKHAGAVWPFHKFFEPLKWQATLMLVLVGLLLVLLLIYLLLFKGKSDVAAPGSGIIAETRQVKAGESRNEPDPEKRVVKAVDRTESVVKAPKKIAPDKNKQRTVSDAKVSGRSRPAATSELSSNKAGSAEVANRNKPQAEKKDKSEGQWRIIK